jgi:hypothetical protein
MAGFYLSLGIAILVPCLQWAFPLLPKLVAYSGAATGAAIMLIEFLKPSLKPSFLVVTLLLIGMTCISIAGYLYTQEIGTFPEDTDKSMKTEGNQKSYKTMVSTGSAVVIRGSSDISFNGTVITGANTGMVIDDSKNISTSNSVISGGPVTIKVPAPTGEYNSSDDIALIRQIQKLAGELKEYETKYGIISRKLSDEWTGQVRNLAAATKDDRKIAWDAHSAKIHFQWENYVAGYKNNFFQSAQSIAAETMKRLGSGAFMKVESPEAAIQQEKGARTILQGIPAGVAPIEAGALFLERLAAQLQVRNEQATGRRAD